MLAVTASLLAGVGYCQSNVRTDTKVVTVCDVIKNPSHYSDAPVAIVGRLERSVSFVDHYEFLAQDRCSRPLMTAGHVWPNRLWLCSDWGEGLPKAPTEAPKFNKTYLSKKLSAVRKTTKLGVHQEPGFVIDGHTRRYTSEVDVPNEWVVVYGRVFDNPSLRDSDCDEAGCGGLLSAPLVLMVEQYNILELNDDGTIRPKP